MARFGSLQAVIVNLVEVSGEVSCWQGPLSCRIFAVGTSLLCVDVGSVCDKLFDADVQSPSSSSLLTAASDRVQDTKPLEIRSSAHTR